MSVRLGNGDIRDRDPHLSVGLVIQFRENPGTKSWNLHAAAASVSPGAGRGLRAGAAGMPL